MQVKDLLRACAALAVYAAGIAVFLVSIIIVIMALARSPLFAILGFGGMVVASMLLRVANTRIAPQQHPSAFTPE